MNPELKPSIKERSLKAFLDLAILHALTAQPMTAYDVNQHFMKKHGVFISPSTIYRNLSTMERNKWIKCISNRHGKVYGLSEQGQEIINGIAAIIEEIQTSIKTLLKKSNTPQKANPPNHTKQPTTLNSKTPASRQTSPHASAFI